MILELVWKINQNKSLLGLLKWLLPLFSRQKRTRELLGVRFKGNIFPAISGPTFHKITSCRNNNNKTPGDKGQRYVPNLNVQLRVIPDEEARFIFFKTCAEFDCATPGMFANMNSKLETNRRD